MDVAKWADKVLYHVNKAAHYQKAVEALEKWATERAREQAFGRARSRLGIATPIEYRAKMLLEDNFWYKVAVGNRNAHESKAKMAQLGMAAQKELDERGES